MREEVDAKITPLKEQGGYILGLDHVTPLDLSYRNFVEYANYIKTKLTM